MRLKISMNKILWPRFKVYLFFALSAVATSLPAAEQLAVFFPTASSVQDIEKALKADKAASGLDIVVFAKFSEFSAAQKAAAAPYIIVPSSYPDFNQDYAPSLQFTSGGKDKYKFEVLAIKDNWKGTNTSEGVIGVIEELERKDTKAYVEKILPGKGFKTIKRVTKLEDLFPLMALDNSDYILIEPGNLRAVKEKFTAATHEALKSIDVGYPVLCIKNGTKGEAAKELKKLSGTTLKALGFDGIKSVGGKG